MQFKKFLVSSVIAVSLLPFSIPVATADAAKPGQSMTHMKTTAGLTEVLEGLGVVLYAQGGATAAVIGDSIASPTSQMVFHIPVTNSKNGIEHLGSNIVFFNTANNKIVQLRNPKINLKTGQVSAVIPQSGGSETPILTISNLKQLSPKVTNDRKAKTRSTAYAGTTLNLATGIGAALNSLLGLPEGSIPEGINFASADVTIYSKL